MVYGNHGIHWALFVWGHFNRSHSDQKYAFHLQRCCYYLYLYDIRWCRCEGLMDWAQNIWEDQYDISEMTETRDLDVIALKCAEIYMKSFLLKIEAGRHCQRPELFLILFSGEVSQQFALSLDADNFSETFYFFPPQNVAALKLISFCWLPIVFLPVYLLFYCNRNRNQWEQ